MFLFLTVTGEISERIYRCRYMLRDSKITICELQATKLPFLKSLTLTGQTEVFNTDQIVHLQEMFNRLHWQHCQELQNIGDMTAVWNLEYLNLSFIRSLGGYLPVLLRHRFPSLETLVLRDCGLNSDDMCSLTEAREKGRLPKLKRLDLSENWMLDHEKWNEIWKDVIKWDDQKMS